MRIPEKLLSAGRIHILGAAGQEGRAVFDYLLASDMDVIGHVSVERDEFEKTFDLFSDAYSEIESRTMAEKFVSSGRMVFGSDYGTGIEKGDAVIAPQAYARYPLNRPIMDMDARGEIMFLQAIEFAFSIADCKLIGVTGTAGKSTVTALIGNMLESYGKPFYFSGNDRDNKWDLFALEAIDKDGFALFEISHRHLTDLKHSPDVAVITNIFPHHLDDAGSFDRYIEIKKNIYRYQEMGDIALVNHSLIKERVVKEEEEVPGRLIYFGGDHAGADGISGAVVEDDSLLAVIDDASAKVSLDEFRAYGEHNIMNALAAMLAGLAAGLPASSVEEGIKNWKGLRYRQELIGEWNGIRIINDGKSTDPLATIEAVKAIPEIGALILGGIREGFSEGDFIPLGREISDKKIKKVFIFGSSKSAMARDLIEAGVESHICTDITDAVSRAIEATNKGEAVVFSPGCQSFDEFKDYRDRAKAFEAAVDGIFG